MKFTFYILLSCLSISVYGQDKYEALTDLIIKQSTHFTIKDGQFMGADKLLSEIRESQFLLLGEMHGVVEIGLLTEALLKKLPDYGYQYFGIETGTYSAEKLTELGNCEEVLSCLHEFYQSEVDKQSEIPIPFFEGKEDAIFLEAAIDNEWKLWGLDQEYLGAAPFILREVMQDKKAANIAAMHIKMGYEDDNYPMFSNLMNDSKISRALVGSTVCIDLKQSWTIYKDWSENRSANLEDRALLMRSLFMQNYNSALKNMESKPKVLLKMGGYHTGRGWSNNRTYELGSLLHELAFINGSKDLNIGFAINHYYEEDGSIGSNLDFSSDWVDQMRPLLSAGKSDKWTVVDLRTIKKEWTNKRIAMPAEIKDLIISYDIILIPPAVRDTTPNYEENSGS